MNREEQLYQAIIEKLGVSNGDAQGIYEAAEMKGLINEELSIEDQLDQILK